MGSLTLYIHGLAMCHYVESDKLWKVYFPKVDEHYFQMVVKKTTKDGRVIIKNLPAKSINIEIKAKGTAGGSEEGITDRLLNITSLISNTPKDPLALRSEPDVYSAILTLHGFKLNGTSYHIVPPNYDVVIIGNGFHNYIVWEKTDEGRIRYPNPLSNKNAVISDEIETSDSDSTEISIDGNTEFLRHEEDVHYEIFLNNQCDKSPNICEPFTDFKFFYNIIDTTISSVKDIELERIQDPPTLGDRVGCDSVIKKP